MNPELLKEFYTFIDRQDSIMEPSIGIFWMDFRNDYEIFGAYKVPEKFATFNHELSLSKTFEFYYPTYSIFCKTCNLCHFMLWEFLKETERHERFTKAEEYFCAGRIFYLEKGEYFIYIDSHIPDYRCKDIIRIFNLQNEDVYWKIINRSQEILL
jgi:hypothetical protein